MISKKMPAGKLYLEFKKLGLQLKLFFSDCYFLGNIMMGLDLKRKKLVIADGVKSINWRHTIALDDLKTVTVKRVYNSIRAGELSFKNVADFIRSIHVRLEFMDGRESIVLPIYGEGKIKIPDIRKIERRLNRWHNKLSRMIRKR